MNLYLSIAFTLLAAVAGMYLLAKSKAENLGRFFSIISYLVIIIAGLSLLCQLGCGALWLACRTGICPPSENCMPGMMMHKKIIMHGMSGECRMHSGCEDADEDGPGEKCCGGMKGCDMEHGEMKMHGNRCGEEMEEEHEGGGHGMKKDRSMEKDTIIKK